MAPRGRPRKAGKMRIDAAIAAVSRLGYKTPLIRCTVNKLLKVYDGEWDFIEDECYKVVVETLLDEQEEEPNFLTYNEEDKDSSSDGAEPSNAHDDARASDAHVGRDAAPCLLHTEGWKDISCMDDDRPLCRETVTAYEQNDGEENRVRVLEANALQGAVGLLPPCRRKPCYGWIRTDSGDEEPDLIFFETEASQRKEMRRVSFPKDCKRRRWDMQEQA